MQACAKSSVVLLDQAAAGQHTFDALFLTSHSPLTTYDYLFHVHIPQQLPVQLHAADTTPWQHAERKLEALMKQVCRWSLIKSWVIRFLVNITVALR